MADTTVIGRTAFVRGKVSGSGDVEVAGRLEGDLTCTGEASVEATGLVAANISARRIVVKGAVKGDLTADEVISIGPGGRVVGDLRAPRIGIAEGGMVRGLVQTSGAGAARPRSAATAAVSRPRAERVERVERVEEKRPAPKAAPPPPPSKTKANGPSKGPARGATLAGARPGPPPPVVPVLKKGTKAVQKKAR